MIQLNLCQSLRFSFIGIIFPLFGFAQKAHPKNDIDAAKEFLFVCNNYKSFPLHVQMQRRSSATFVFSNEDTATVDGEFFLTVDGGYIRYGNVEQVVNDSLILMVSEDQRMMVLGSNQQNARTQLSSYLGLFLADSSAIKLNKQFTSAFINTSHKDTGTIELTNRSTLPGTRIIKEVITLKYNSKTKEPISVTHMRKTLMPIDKNEWDSLPGHETLEDKLVKIDDNLFLVNERSFVSDFRKISHENTIVLPVRIADRVRRNRAGEFVGVQGFEDYYVSVQ